MLKNTPQDAGGWSGALFWVHFPLVEGQADRKMAEFRMLLKVSSPREQPSGSFSTGWGVMGTMAAAAFGMPLSGA